MSWVSIVMNFQTPSLIIRQTKKGPELIPVELSAILYAGWMRNATLMVDENTTDALLVRSQMTSMG